VCVHFVWLHYANAYFNPEQELVRKLSLWTMIYEGLMGGEIEGNGKACVPNFADIK
jgi:hypothetical protein